MGMPSQYTLYSQDVCTLAINTLAQLPLKARGDHVEVRDLLHVLVVAAASRLSINQACHDLDGAPSAVTVLGDLARQLHDLDQLEEALNALLARLVPNRLGKRGRRVAIDLIELPYHGSVDEAHQDEVRRSKAKQGTMPFFTYASAYAIVGGKRYTLALCRVRAKMTMDQVLKRLPHRLDALVIKVRVLLLDRGFYSVKVSRALIDRQQPFIMPAIRRGKPPTQTGGPTGTYVMAQWTGSAWTSYTLSSAQDGSVTFDLAVVCPNLRGRWGRHRREAWLYATWGLKRRALAWIRQTYRSRFGIESSYRQVHQAKIKTSSRNPVLRLLFVGVAFVLRNVWVWVHAEMIAQPRRGGRRLMSVSLRFARLLLWLVVEVARQYRLLREISVYRDMYQVAQEFGVTFNY
jgi:putative transposase